VTTPLSPAAQAVLDAFFASDDWEDEPPHANIAAALRAAADQVVPSTYAQLMEDYELGVWVANDDTRTELLAIASELENQ
jgi:hypothetical protein